MPKRYLCNTRSPTMRSYLTKLRIDTNCTLDSHVVEVNKSEDRTWRDNGVTQNVKHVLVECKMKNLSETRNLFENRISKQCMNYRTLSDVFELKQYRLMLNVQFSEKLPILRIEISCPMVASEI